MRSQKVLGYLLVGMAYLSFAGYAANAAEEPPLFKFDLHGIVGTSLYVQSNPSQVLNGQGPLLLTTENATSGQSTTGFDLRQTRLRFSVSGPQVLGGATTHGVVESDFFNLEGPGGYGEINLMNRLRIAYAELNWGDTSIRFGQDWELLFNEFPTSLGHMAFPVTYFAGLSGWRGAGVTFFHKYGISETSNLEGAIQVLRSDWEAPYDFGRSTSNQLNVSAGQLSALPGLEGRLKWTSGKDFVYLAGHWSQVDGTKVSALIYPGVAGADVNPISTSRKWDVLEGKVGGKVTFSDFTLQGDFYVGKNTAPLIGEELQWYTANDVHEVGGWAQLGYNFTKTLSIWGVYGTSRSNEDQVRSAGGGRFANTVAGGMLMYREGPFGIGPEFYHIETKSTKASGAGAPDGVMDGNQFMFSGMLFF